MKSLILIEHQFRDSANLLCSTGIIKSLLTPCNQADTVQQLCHFRVSIETGYICSK